MFSYSAICDVPVETLDLLASLLHRHRQAPDARPHQRTGTDCTQVKLVLRWFRDGTRVADLARDHHLCQATGYRYLGEGMEVLAATAPELHKVLENARKDGTNHLMLDGTLVPTDRRAERTKRGNHHWY